MKEITEKQKCIAEQSVYGDLIGYHKEGHICKMDIRYVENDYNYSPILRPMSLLTKEITHKGYNNDKPFIPSEKIKEMLSIEDNDFEDSILNTTRVKYAPSEFWFGSMQIILDFLNMLHFDTRDLITKGAAVSTEEVGDVYDVKQ